MSTAQEGVSPTKADDYAAAMDGTTTRRIASRSLTLPNALTYARIAAVPAVVACMFGRTSCKAAYGCDGWARDIHRGGGHDILDGYFARGLGPAVEFRAHAGSIADKLLVSSCLLMLAADGTIRGGAVGGDRDSMPRNSGFGAARISAELRVGVR